jgi:hypothetical protein
VNKAPDGQIISGPYEGQKPRIGFHPCHLSAVQGQAKLEGQNRTFLLKFIKALCHGRPNRLKFVFPYFIFSSLSLDPKEIL